MMRMIPTDIWNFPDAWPIDPPGYTFLARAFNDIGRAKFGDEWDPELPPDPEGEGQDDDDSVEGFAAWSKAWRVWQKASAEVEAKAREMNKAVRHEVAGQCLLGHLITAVRPISGGVMTEIHT